MEPGQGIQTILKENRSFPPPESFRRHSNVSDPTAYATLWKSSQENPIRFWEEAASSIHWFQKWDKTLDWKEPFAKWFVGATTNASYNCLDRHLETSGDKLALIWEGEDGAVVTLTYTELYQRVCQVANGLERKLGLKAGDTAAIYLPLVPEAVVAMLACARIGVTHSVIFAGFASHAIRDRVQDAGCKVIFTSDVGYRRGTSLELLKTVQTAVTETPTVEKVVVLRRLPSTVLGSKELDWAELMDGESKTHVAKELDAEHPLYFLYTSGTTGKPKGIVHSTGGYLVGVNLTARWVLDLKPSDVYWCTADIGWVTGHSYVVYGVLSNAGTALIYEGNLVHPHPGRIWEIIDKHKVSILYTAPTAIRSFMRSGDEIPKKFKLNSLRLLGTVGEPINPEAWMWYHHLIGKDRCPIVDTWWQTETGAIMISALPGVTALETRIGDTPVPRDCRRYCR